jgi:ferritin-like metal-binding protein YciE
MLAENLSDIFQRGLEFAYDCEHQLIKGLPRAIEAAGAGDLKAALTRQLAESKEQQLRLEKVFAGLHRAPAEESNQSIHSIIGEAEKMIKHIDASPLRDATLILNGNLIHHHKIALYGSLSALARVLGLPDAAPLLDQTLTEEHAGDRRLTQISTAVNQQALAFQQKPHGFAII